jgi:hypothetical protein
MNQEGSDIDIRGITMPPPWLHISRYNGFDQDEHPTFENAPEVVKSIEKSFLARGQMFEDYSFQSPDDNLDAVIYDVGKAIYLMGKCNPNMLELLFTDPQDVIYLNEFGERLREKRSFFLSTKIKHTYSGYAHAQLKKIQRHRGWLMEGDVKKPSRKDYGLPEHESLRNEGESNLINEEINAIILGWSLHEFDLHPADREVLSERIRNFMITKFACSDDELEFKLEDLAAFKLGLSADVRQALDMERKYRAAMRHYKSFLKWKNERNPKRKEFEDKYGFDVKNASHLIRLMRTGCEVLETGNLIVRRPDAEDLLAIRRGERSYESILEEAKILEIKIEKLYKENPANLPHKVNTKVLDNIHKEIVEDYIRVLL